MCLQGLAIDASAYRHWQNLPAFFDLNALPCCTADSATCGAANQAN